MLSIRTTCVSSSSRHSYDVSNGIAYVTVTGWHVVTNVILIIDHHITQLLFFVFFITRASLTALMLLYELD